MPARAINPEPATISAKANSLAVATRLDRPQAFCPVVLLGSLERSFEVFGGFLSGRALPLDLEFVLIASLSPALELRDDTRATVDRLGRLDVVGHSDRLLDAFSHYVGELLPLCEVVDLFDAGQRDRLCDVAAADLVVVGRFVPSSLFDGGATGQFPLVITGLGLLVLVGWRTGYAMYVRSRS
jgi:hypothetical protein